VSGTACPDGSCPSGQHAFVTRDESNSPGNTLNECTQPRLHSESGDDMNDLRVVIRTPNSLLLDAIASELEVEDQLGRFTVVAGGEPALAALVPSTLVVRKADGSEIRVQITWGSLTAVGNQARMIVESGDVHLGEPIRIAV
jgi:hypothetical protein